MRRTYRQHARMTSLSWVTDASALPFETLLKGVEVELPDGVTFNDKDGHPRNAVRIRWWDDKAVRLGDVALPLDLDIGDAAELPIPDDAPAYADDNPPCFIGHYWLSGPPEPLTSKIACLDYSVAMGEQ